MNITNILKELSTHFISLTDRGLLYGPQGKMLLRNLEQHWFLHCVTMSPYNIFLSDEIINTYDFIAKTATSNMPFGLAKVKSSKDNWNRDISTTLILNLHKTAEVAIFNNDTETKDLFHKLQKNRKTWWRRLAQCPSRFNLTEAKKVKNNELIDIEAQFPFGNVIVERITYYTDVQKLFSQIDDKKDFSHQQMIEHTVSLDWGCLALLCDAYDLSKKTRMQIHSKLAPHKVAFRIKRPSDKANVQNDDLNRFVLYLNNMLKTKGLNTILTTSEQIIDTCLVPFIVLVDTTSLENGIISVMDRSTTLSETVHVTDLVKYISMRC
ncbi:DNA polymerase subunit gamma-2, mitochondrial [Megachile rotundata]|uniref:DNA polymerase subunit gamma-2, mitochondrial n=1 Tax=Megachile rotundata TaxID=143995 RepID=UPI003FD4E81B